MVYWGGVSPFSATECLENQGRFKPYVKTNKNDAADAEAIREAASCPNMRFVPIKNNEQLAVLAIHRARQEFVRARTAQANQLRGLLAEHGIIIPKGIRHISQHLPDILEVGDNGLLGWVRQLLDRLSAHFKELDKLVRELDVQLQSWHQDSPASQKLTKIPGIGPLTASALVATIGNAKQFQNGQQLVVWLGLVPRQYSSGDKPTRRPVLSGLYSPMIENLMRNTAQAQS